MSWSKRQIITVQTYRRLARLPDTEYRALLKEISGAFSSKDASLTQYHFDQTMAHIEAKLVWRVAEGLAPEPPRDQVRDPGYWRRRCARPGECNSRLAYRARRYWQQLQQFLPAEQQTDAYLAAIASHACGYRVRDIYAIKAWQAGLLIEALKDRLHYALVKAGRPDIEDGLADAVIPGRADAEEPQLGGSPAPLPRGAMGTSPGATPPGREAPAAAPTRDAAMPLSGGAGGARQAPHAIPVHAGAGGDLPATDEGLPF